MVPSSTGAGSASRRPVPVAIALGSNLGDRDAHLGFAVDQLATRIDRLVVSSVFETEPVGVGPQPPFHNAAAVGLTTLEPAALLEFMLDVERRRGRERLVPGAARTLDLDLVLYGDRIIHQPGLEVPHPRFRERAFVLDPLCEIAADWQDPVTGRTIAELRVAL